VKIITLGAGSGSRLSGGGGDRQIFDRVLPKIISPVLDHDMFWWSMQSYHHWLTRGIINQNDLIFVLQKAHNRNFGIVEKIEKEFGSGVNFAFVEDLTKGPAESAFAGIEFVGTNEDFIVNDCDHYFSSSSFLELIDSVKSKTESSDFLLLPITKTGSNLPTWSYAITEPIEDKNFFRVLQIKEKDPDLAQTGSPGVIGSYYFSSRELFQKLFAKTFDNASGEYFISRMIECGIAAGISVFSSEARFGFPLGTPDEIENFEKKLKGIQTHYLARSIFFDIDGVLVKHDSGYHSSGGTYTYPGSIIEKNVSILRNHYRLGDSIILTTSRPIQEKSRLEFFLKNNWIPYHHLIMGLNPGVRIIINDRKNTEFSIDTAIALSIGRNNDLDQLTHLTSLGDKVKDCLTSGSGAETYRLESKSGVMFIRKATPLKEFYSNEIKVLQIQGLWLDKVKKIIPYSVPRVIHSGKVDCLQILDMEDLGDLPKFSQLVLSNQVGDVNLQLIVSDFLDKLSSLYETTATSKILDSTYPKILFREVILNKAIPALNSLFTISTYSKWNFQHLDQLIFNGRQVQNPIKILHKVIENQSIISRFEKSISGGKKCIIHGDLTLENVLIDSEMKVKFIDPLGALMDPTIKNHNRNSLSLTTPFFDLIKILQSLDAGYENWNSTKGVAGLSQNGEITWSEELIPKGSVIRQSILDFFGRFGISADEKTLFLFKALQLFRLIPYKLRTSHDKAWFCLAVGSFYLEKSLD
jgi:NDP-sugar pyrophosphorylase family protein